MENTSKSGLRTFSTHDLNKQVGEVTDAASRAPVVITRHRKPRFVMMSLDHFERLLKDNDPRRAYGAGETPPEIAAIFLGELNRLTAEGPDGNDR